MTVVSVVRAAFVVVPAGSERRMKIPGAVIVPAGRTAVVIVPAGIFRETGKAPRHHGSGDERLHVGFHGNG